MSFSHFILFALAGALSGALTAHSMEYRGMGNLVRAALAGAVMGLVIAGTVQ